MSAEALPISASQFALAIHDLPVATLNNKAIEIRNSIAHLKHSNDQLDEFAQAGDQDCVEAMAENQLVMRRMEERIALLRAEVENRGLRWYEDHEAEEVKVNGVTGSAPQALVNGDGAAHAQTTVTTSSQPRTSGRLTDEQLQAMLAERLGEADDHDDDDGVHL